MNPPEGFNYVFCWKQSPMRPENRRGQKCRVLKRGWMNSILVEFEDGFKMLTSRRAVRKIKDEQEGQNGDI